MTERTKGPKQILIDAILTQSELVALYRSIWLDLKVLPKMTEKESQEDAHQIYTEIQSRTLRLAITLGLGEWLNEKVLKPDLFYGFFSEVKDRLYFEPPSWPPASGPPLLD